MVKEDPKSAADRRYHVTESGGSFKSHSPDLSVAVLRPGIVQRLVTLGAPHVPRRPPEHLGQVRVMWPKIVELVLDEAAHDLIRIAPCPESLPLRVSERAGVRACAR